MLELSAQEGFLPGKSPTRQNRDTELRSLVSRPQPASLSRLGLFLTELSSFIPSIGSVPSKRELFIFLFFLFFYILFLLLEYSCFTILC